MHGDHAGALAERYYAVTDEFRGGAEATDDELIDARSDRQIVENEREGRAWAHVRPGDAQLA